MSAGGVFIVQLTLAFFGLQVRFYPDFLFHYLHYITLFLM